MPKLSLERYSQQQYDTFGKAYQKTRDEGRPERLYNEQYELPSMLRAVGDVKGKRLLDVGCGAGIHTAAYAKKGAKPTGCDISKTMVAMARERYPKLTFEVCPLAKLPFRNASFDVVTASLMVHYVDDLRKAFAEAARVLKKGGIFYFSTTSPVADFREVYEDDNCKVNAIGYVKDKRTQKKTPLGTYFEKGIVEFEMVPGMVIKHHKRSVRDFLLALQSSGFELVDIIDCEPTPEFAKRDLQEYQLLTKFPMFSIYVCRRK